MCRNIRTLFDFEPPATEDEVRASALQFVRKLSGFNAPSQANAAAFDRAVEEVSDAARRLWSRSTQRAHRVTVSKRRRRRGLGRGKGSHHRGTFTLPRVMTPAVCLARGESDGFHH